MSDYLEIHRGAVAQWECDHMGHWNVQFYMARVSEGLAHLRQHFFAGEAAAPRWTPLEVLVRYMRELHAGDVFIIQAGVMAASEAALELDINIINPASGAVAANMEIWVAPWQVETADFGFWPAAAVAAFQAAQTERAHSHRPASTLDPPRLADQPLHDPFISGRSTTNTWDCDETGYMAVHKYFDRASDAVGHIRGRLGFSSGLVEGIRLGSAALEYRMSVLKRLAPGDIINLTSGVNDISGKTFRFGHVMTGGADNAVCAVYDVLGIFFDLDARKAVAPPPVIQENFAALMIPWLSARHPRLL